MKKIFAIISALVLSASAFATHYNYNPTEITSFNISDDSVGSSYAYTITVKQRGKNGSWYDSEATFYLYPSSHSFVGEFMVSDNTLDSYSYVYYNGATRPFIDSDSYWTSDNMTVISITDNGDGTYTFGGTVICSNTSGSNAYRYQYSDYQFEVSKPDPYENEPSEKKSFTISENNMYVYSSKGETPIEMYAWNLDNYADIDLLFNVASFDIPAGDYEISASGELGTVIAGDGTAAKPSCYHAANWEAEYYLVSGTLTVSYADGNMNISGTATTAHGSTVKIDISGKDPFGHAVVSPVIYEANEDGVTATATGLDADFTGDTVIIDGTVTINGKSYTVTAIADQAFTGKSGLKNIVIPATVETIGKAAFSFCTGLEGIECQGAAAPAAGKSAFYKINPAISVVVPAASVDSYKAADGWKMFTGISGR